MVAEGPSLGSRTGGQDMGLEGGKEGALIDEIMPGVRNQSDAVQDQSSDKLGGDDDGVQCQGEAEAGMQSCIRNSKGHYD